MASIVPYLPTPTTHIPFLGERSPFGLLVLVGLVLGWRIALREVDKASVKRIALDKKGNKVDWVRDMMWWTLVASLIGAKLFDPFVYDHEPSLRAGMSSTGGVLGAAAGALTYLLKHARYRHLMVVIGDCAVLGLSVGWVFCRMGCFLVHDHKGAFSDFVLAVPFPEGQRHDLGLYEMLFTMSLAAVLFHLSSSTKNRPGFSMGVAGLLYGPARFAFEFLRPESTDLRYVGLTPAQWGAGMLTFFASWILARSLRGLTQVECLGPLVDGRPVPAWTAKEIRDRISCDTRDPRVVD